MERSRLCVVCSGCIVSVSSPHPFMWATCFPGNFKVCFSFINHQSGGEMFLDFTFMLCLYKLRVERRLEHIKEICIRYFFSFPMLQFSSPSLLKLLCPNLETWHSERPDQRKEIREADSHPVPTHHTASLPPLTWLLWIAFYWIFYERIIHDMVMVIWCVEYLWSWCPLKSSYIE